ncbi:FtsX-like permease family protein [Actinoallomurus soli]|uniref:FtsX-like permease family protein n=1 Tax=Actinoallomurus soli TaxID=2952535 RepID=UPI0020931DD4|nr:FtsX-like permease family protein [Actinoallomurus soli]MCO5970788.1 FtsX-like permease family protein [Actinoallomurus soli]
MLRLAFGQIRTRPATFAGLATALFMAVTAITLFGSLIAASVVSPPAHGSQPGLVVIGGAFGEIAMLVALFVVVNTLGFAIRQQHRDLALLRTVAATPGQVRGLVRRQVLIVVSLVSPAGWAAGTLGAHRFLAALVARDLVPAGSRIPFTPVPAAAGSVLSLGLGTLAAVVAARPVCRITPAVALGESVGGDRRADPIRTPVGLLALAGGGVLCLAIARQPPDKAGQGALLATLVFLVAVALLGPLFTVAVVTVLGLPLRAVAPRSGRLADANLRGYAARLSSAVVPLALLTSLACVFLSLGDTVRDASRHLAGTELASVTSAADIWLRQVELIILVCFGGVSTVNTLAALTAARRREFALLTLVGATRRQLVSMLCAECLLITAVGTLTGTAVAGATVTSFSVTLPGSPLPSMDPGGYGRIAVGVAVLAALGILLTGLRATSGPATETVAGQRG